MQHTDATVLPELKILVFNAENLFLLSDIPIQPEHLSLSEERWRKLSTSVFDNKPLAKLRQIANLIATTKPDIVLLVEVGGLESLSNFNRLFLNNGFSNALLEGNSNRHIDVGYLVRKDLPFYFDVFSNRNFLLQFNYPHEKGRDIPSHKFSRDVSELHLFTKKQEVPFLIFLLTHLKSRLDPENIDPNGSLRREAECRALVSLSANLRTQHPNVPMVIAGDFNGNLDKNNPDPEFRFLYEKTDWVDVCELANLPAEKRATYYQVSRQHRSEGRQIDYAFLPKLTQRYLDPQSVQVLRFQDASGLNLDPPTTLEAKSALPSDHYPLSFTLKHVPLKP